ncbi:MAG: hypothetical protein ACKO3R_00255 [bacterium]
MGSIIEALSGFTGHVKLLQTGIQNLSNIIPGVLNSTEELSTRLKQLPADVLRNLHKPMDLESSSAKQPIVGETNSDPDSLARIELDLMKSQSYEERSRIYYSEAALAIEKAYQFNHGLFQDSLNSSYVEFIRSIDKEFTQNDQSFYRFKDQVIPKIKNDFTLWLQNFNSVHDSINGASPIDNIQEKYPIPFTLMYSQAVQEIRDKESKAAEDSLKWLNLAGKSLNLLYTINRINTDNAPFDAATLNPRGIYETGELKKFLLKELEEKFNPKNIEKLVKHCKKHHKLLNLSEDAKQNLIDLQTTIKNFKSDSYKESVSELDINQGLTINVRNIDYIEGFFTKKTENREEIDTQRLYMMLNSVHQAYTEKYTQEGYVGEKDRNKIASQILNIVQLLKKQSTPQTQESRSEKQENFINSLENFYTIEKEKTASL